jgi:hypothetical protein
MAHTTLIFVGITASMILVVGLTVAYLPQPSMVTRTINRVQDPEETGSPDGLVLGAGMNVSTVPPGKTVSLQIWERNSLDLQNNVTTAADWPFGDLSLGPRGSMNYPFGFKVLSGYYAVGSPDLDSAKAVELYAPGVYSCPAIYTVGSYSFYPQSTSATLSCALGPCFTEAMNVASEIRGEYVGESVNVSALPSGVYTVVVGDEWGAFVLLYLVVSSSGSQGIVILPAGTSIEVSSSYDCAASHFNLQFTSASGSFLTGGFVARSLGATLYVATLLEASNLTRGHPSQWIYTTGIQNSTRFEVSLSQGTYVIWIEGADLNCGAKIVMPLEALTQVNVTQSLVLTTTGASLPQEVQQRIAGSYPNGWKVLP